jgi:bacillolysin
MGYWPTGSRPVAALGTALAVQLLCAGPVLGDDPELANMRSSHHRTTGKLRFMAAEPGRSVLAARRPSHQAPEDYGLAFARQFGAAFGIQDPASQLRPVGTTPRPGGGNHLRYQQVHQGVPVFAGELIVSLDTHNALVSMNGEISPDLKLAVAPGLTADQAREIAVAAVAKWHGQPSAALVADPPELNIYDARLLKPSVLQPSLAWKTEVRAKHLAPIRELLLVDAHTGAISLHFNQVHRAKDRDTHDAAGGDGLPGVLVCSEADAFPDCAASDADVINAHDFAGDAYDFYAAMHTRDGIDNAGGTLVSTVHWDDGESCPNAFWNGVQMAYCDGMADADDVVAHELTHGVTNSESNLLYYYESGAINESLSDVFGEFIDLDNGKGDDSSSVRWLLGEDLGAIGGAIRDMAFPGTFGDPDRMTSADYWTSSADNGGVHINSGINNKASYLITDGDSFNGFTVAGLGLAKAAKIYYEAQTNLLTSGADYGDLYEVLYQACHNLMGTAGISSGDCLEVRNATDAVEMNLDPAGDPDFSPEAAMCPVDTQLDTILLADDMETAGDWFTTTISGAENDWAYVAGYAKSGLRALYAPDIEETSDSAVWSGPVSLPENAYLHFSHGFGFESGVAQHWDGGVIEYSTDGVTWQDLDGLFDDGQGYGGNLHNNSDNPLAGREAFVSESHGYVSSRYDLGSLAGEDFQVRFRLGSDQSVGGPIGWVVDDVTIYRCIADVVPDCSGIDVLIQDRIFDADASCIAENSLAANTNVVIKPGATVTFQSPTTALGPGFSVEIGGVLQVSTSP